MLAWLITDINGISHANLILRIRHVCRSRSVDKVCHVCLGWRGRLGGEIVTLFVRFRAFTLRFGAFGSNSQTDRQRQKERETEAKALGLSLFLV